MLAHVLSSSSPLHGFLREAEATLTEVFTRRDIEEERRERIKKNRKIIEKEGREWKERERKRS